MDHGNGAKKNLLATVIAAATRQTGNNLDSRNLCIYVPSFSSNNMKKS